MHAIILSTLTDSLQVFKLPASPWHTTVMSAKISFLKDFAGVNI
jgi:hypothetical protein